MPRGQDRRVRAAIILASVLLAGCDAAPSALPDVPPHRLGETFIATRQKDEMLEGGFGVAVLDVLEDSRCPKTVTCVWQGAAVVRLSMIDGSGQRDPRWIALATSPDARRSFVYEGYRVELVDVMPYPDVPKKIEPYEYRVSLRVTRAP
jgi:hypothetical protein